jgi:hypothetical protein
VVHTNELTLPSKQIWHIAADRRTVQKVGKQCNSPVVGSAERHARPTRLKERKRTTIMALLQYGQACIGLEMK